MSLFSFLSNLFNKLFNATKEAWNELPVPTQNAIINGQGILSIINEGATLPPTTVAATILADYPAEAELDIYTGLVSVAKSFNILPATVPSDLPGIVAVIQPYLKSLDESVWPAIIQGAANILGLALSPGATTFEVISTLAQWVYTNFIKSKVITFVTPALSADVNTAASLIGAVDPNSEVSTVAKDVQADITPGS